MNMFDILTKLANIAGQEQPSTIKEWGGDPEALKDPNSMWYQGSSNSPDRDPSDQHSDLVDSWADAVEDELAQYNITGQLSDDQIDELSGTIADDLGAPHEVVLQIVQGLVSERDNEPDVDMGQEYGDDFDESQRDTSAYGETMEKDLSMEGLRVLSGLNKTIAECGIPTAMVGGSNTPASINITAGSGPELTGMLKDIMSLAGVSKAETHPSAVSVDASPAAVISAEPVSAGPSIHDVISKIDSIEAEPDLDSMNDNEEEETDESSSGGFEQATTKPEPKMGPDGVRQFGDMNNGDHGDRMDGMQPRGHVKKESMESFVDSLYADYQSFVTEGKPSAGMSKKEKSAVVKKAKAGKDIGKPGKGFAKVEKAAAKGGAKDPKAVAAAAMWKSQAKK